MGANDHSTLASESVGTGGASGSFSGRRACRPLNHAKCPFLLLNWQGQLECQCRPGARVPVPWHSESASAQAASASGTLVPHGRNCLPVPVGLLLVVVTCSTTQALAHHCSTGSAGVWDSNM